MQGDAVVCDSCKQPGKDGGDGEGDGEPGLEEEQGKNVDDDGESNGKGSSDGISRGKAEKDGKKHRDMNNSIFIIKTIIKYDYEDSICITNAMWY